MLSDWFEGTDLYLARNLCLLRVGEKVHLRIEASEPEDVTVLLKRLDVELSTGQILLGKRLRVMLSAALAPAIPLQLLEEVQGCGAGVAILPALASSDLALKTGQITTQIQANGPTLGAAVAQKTSNAIAQWSEAHALRLLSMQPIWHIASDSAALHANTCQGLQIHEADGSLLLVKQDGQWSQFYQGADMPIQARESVLRRIKIGLGLREQDVMSLSFGEKAEQPDDPLPMFWSACWSNACGGSRRPKFDSVDCA